jgi:hypothetical protein
MVTSLSYPSFAVPELVRRSHLFSICSLSEQVPLADSSGGDHNSIHSYREIPEEHRSLAFKYLIFEKLLREKKKVPQHLGVISVEDALRLYHYMNGLKACSERCIELWSPPEESAKGTCSESEQIENRCERRTSSGTANDGPILLEVNIIQYIFQNKPSVHSYSDIVLKHLLQI